MNHNIRISVGAPKGGFIFGCRKFAVREKILKFFLGELHRVIVIVPGDSVKEICVVEEKEQG